MGKKIVLSWFGFIIIILVSLYIFMVFDCIKNGPVSSDQSFPTIEVE